MQCKLVFPAQAGIPIHVYSLLPFLNIIFESNLCLKHFNAPTNKDLSSMKHASTVGGAFRAGAVSTLLPGSYGALVCENASRDT